MQTFSLLLPTGVLGLGSGSYQPIPKLVGGVKRAVSVAAGGDYTLVLTSATVPDMPFSDKVLQNDSSIMGLRANQLGKASKSNIVVVTGLYSKSDAVSKIQSDVINGNIPVVTSGLADTDEDSDDESQHDDDGETEDDGDGDGDGDGDDGEIEDNEEEYHDLAEREAGTLNVKKAGTTTGRSIKSMRFYHSHHHKCNMIVECAHIHPNIFYSDL